MARIYFITRRLRGPWVSFFKEMLRSDFRFLPVSFQKAEREILDSAFMILVDICGCRKSRRDLSTLVRSLARRDLRVVIFTPTHETIATITALEKAGAVCLAEYGVEPTDEKSRRLLTDSLLRDLLLAASR